MPDGMRGLLIALICTGCATAPDELALLRERFALGATLEQTRAAARTHCAAFTEVAYDAAMSAPYREQTQIDCHGYAFDGAPRKLELLVNEGELGFYWLLMEGGELAAARAQLRRQFGAPDCVNADYVGFESQGVALRNEPPELLIARPGDFGPITGCGASG